MATHSTQQPPVKVGLISLGCAKNMVDAEIMLGSLLKEGLQITNDAAEADVVIVNTCSFIDAAQEESVDTILESASLRQARRPGQALVVSGCMPQRYSADLPKLMPEVDAFIGIDQVTRIGEVVREALARRAQKAESGARGRPASQATAVATELARLDNGMAARKPARGRKLRGTEQFGRTKTLVSAPLVDVHVRPSFVPDYNTPRFRLTPRHFAYIKVAEGCNHPCSFCIIPRMRGTHRSRPQDDVVQEARLLVREGVKELNLISQDSTYYGLDLRPGHSRAIASPERFTAAAGALPAGATTLCTLLRELNSIQGDFWIRILYTHPAHWTDELISTIAECRKVVRYVDIPLQHIHENLLQRMRRETSRQHIVDLIQRIRAGIPGIALRTTFIVGFPGETESCFQELLEFVRATRFERLGVFTYSREEGTVAGRMSGQVSDVVKARRRDALMAEQHRIARELSGAQVGRVVKVLVEKEASARELQAASVSSWEHGLIREGDQGMPRLKGRYLIARGEADAPDIDGRIYVKGDLPIGRFARVKIVGHTDYDLMAVP
jgi:ribosomal protein S12 methylthiotransferase